MSTNTRIIKASTDAVWDVLGDGWLYPVFVVGASRMREVDRSWPAVGAQLHHSVGVWPLLIDDTTQVLESTTSTVLKLRARGWPLGSAEVTFHLEKEDALTRVTLQEHPVAGPGLLVPRPVREAQLQWRNTETLRRLAYIAERRTASDAS